MTGWRARFQEHLVTYVLLAGMILCVAWAIEGANWADGLTRLIVLGPAGVAAGLALASWRRLPALVAHVLAVGLGLVLLVGRLDPLLPLAANAHGWRPAWDFLWSRGAAWFRATGTDQYADDYYLFMLGLGTVIWLLGYTSAYMVFRFRWTWPALLAPAIALLLNLGYAPVSLTAYLVLFLICGLLLVARAHVARREADWRLAGIRYPEHLGWRALGTSLLVVGLTVSFAWTSPVSARGALFQQAWSRVSDPWQRLEDRFGQVFSSVRGPGNRGVGNFASFGERFRLGGPLKLSQTPLLLLKADRPFYLKTRTYDTFDGAQWSSSVTTTLSPNSDGQPYAPQIDLRPGQELGVTPPTKSEPHDLAVTIISSRSSALFLADQFVSADRSTYVQLSWTQYRNRSLDLTTLARDNVPADLQRLYDLLKAAPPLPDTDDLGKPLPPPMPTVPAPTRTGRAGTPIGASGSPVPTTTPTPSPTPSPTPVDSPQARQIAAELLSLQTRLIDAKPVIKGGTAVRLIVNGPVANYGDVEAVVPHEGMRRGSEYTTTVLSSNATAPELRAATGSYPEWVTQRYLQLPGSTTQRTHDLAVRLAGGQNPYDAAITIQNYVRDNMAYNENIPFPPPGRDVVDYFLFDSKQGYCEYYSTAMVVMLRALGIPTREVVGLYSVEFNKEQNGYLYRESNAHAWPEVYFPGYGWIAFEPTASRPTFNRDPAPPPADNSAANPDTGAVAGGTGPLTGGDAVPPDDELRGMATGRALMKKENRALEVLRIAVPLTAGVGALLAFLWFRAFRGLSPSGQLFTRVSRASRWAGVRAPPGATPFEQADLVGQAVPGTRRSLTQITALYVAEQYGRHQPTPQEVRLARRAWLRFRGALLRSLLTLRRRPLSTE